MQPTSFTLKIFLTPSKNPESTRIEINKIPVSLTIHEKQRMKKFCGNVCPFSSKKVLRLAKITVKKCKLTTRKWSEY